MAQDSLIRIDEILAEFSREHNARLFRNYRDIPSRSLFWWDKGLLKFIQLKDVSGGSLELWVGAYRLPIPLMNFWTVYLDLPNDFCKKLTEIGGGAIQGDEFLGSLRTAKGILDPLSKKNVPYGETSAAIRRNLLIPENLLSVFLILGVIVIVVFLVSRFLH